MELRVGNRYRLGRKIGSGSFGDIYLGELLWNNISVVVSTSLDTIRVFNSLSSAHSEFPKRPHNQSAVLCLVLATLATELAVCVAKQLAVTSSTIKHLIGNDILHCLWLWEHVVCYKIELMCKWTVLTVRIGTYGCYVAKSLLRKAS